MKELALKLLKYLIIQIHHENRRSKKAVHNGLLLAVKSHISSFNQDYLNCKITVAIAGPFSSVMKYDTVHQEIKHHLSGFPLIPVEESEEVDNFIKYCGQLQIIFQFQVCERSAALKTDCLILRQFLHRVSLVHPQVQIHFIRQINSDISFQTFGMKQDSRINWRKVDLITDSTHFVKSPHHSLTGQCEEIHPVKGRGLYLSIPENVVESWFCDDITICAWAAVCPCLRQHPYIPARIGKISISLM
ncbi:DUF4554 domain-containing protein [Erpetoichthys calabaricus]|uniref:DUF4554 domain-containing protein n=1 Tax=Erpetoichthys calabaricus TaxID=27687 RepID=UPI0022344B58|nr:DUF4554 domain-containing protein [Erpetoichthys calabaricus]